MPASNDATVGAVEALQPAQGAPAVFFLLCPERSAFNASFTLAERLKEHGYDVVYLGTPDFEEYVTAQGLGYESFSMEPNPRPKVLGRAWPASIRRWYERRQAFLNHERGCKQIIERAERLVKQRRPVLMLVDPLVSWRSELPYRCGISSIGVNATMATTLDVRIPPVFSELMPGRENSAGTMLRNAAAWAKCLLPNWCRRFRNEKIYPLTLGLLPRRSPVSMVKGYGARVLWGEYGPWLDLPELVLSVRELEFPRSAEVRARTYVGSCIHLPRTDGRFDWQGIDSEKPLVYCSLGTYSQAYPNAKRFFMSVVEALKRKEGLQGIVQIGNAAEIDEFGALPDRIRLVKFVPQLEVLQRARAFVTHGGPSSIREAIYFGVPTIVLPCWYDQLGNGARVVYHGLGVRADIATITTEAMSALLDEIMDERFIHANVRMQKHFHDQLRCQAGIELVESFLRGGEPRGSALAAAMPAADAIGQ